MAFFVCSNHHAVVRSKPIACYWGWWNTGDVKVGRLQKLCVDCFAQTLLPLDVQDTPEQSLTCAACGIDITDDHQQTFVTYFVGGRDRRRLEIAMCPSCTTLRRGYVTDNSTMLEDAGTYERPEPRDISADEVLRALGRNPGHGG